MNINGYFDGEKWQISAAGSVTSRRHGSVLTTSILAGADVRRSSVFPDPSGDPTAPPQSL